MLTGLAVAWLIAGLHWYLWRRLVRDTTRHGSRWRIPGAVVLAVGACAMCGAFAVMFGGVDRASWRWLTWPGFLWAALFLYLLLGVLAGEVVRPLLLRGLVLRDAGTTAPAGAGPATAPDAVTAPESTAAATPQPVGAAVGEVPGAGAPPGSAPGPVGSAMGGPEAPAPHGESEAPGRRPISRRMLVSRLAAGATVIAAGAVVGTGTYGVLDGPAVRRVTVPLAKLPARAHGLRIALVSDLHLGPALGRAFCERVVRTVNDTRPDLIAVAGDLADGTAADLRAETEPLAGLSAPLGVYFVPGNHEYFSDADAWLTRVGELGMKVLLNDRVSLPDFDLAGVDDPRGTASGRGPDFAAALDGRDAGRACVLLAHQPVVIHESVAYGVDLQLSGHTHGGQLWPGNLIARLPNPTVAGLELYGGTALYVTRGAGAWGPPVRVAAPSDITVLELASLQGV
ncbi:metallophosphoesterase [Nocardia jinanensis]|uniref:Membrane protein n=1 Tax=Nocardia jinanensis TaxID=382504 RepID=A0A917RCX5_9NOCA|nr:metallophosphoesterase [Nocardia jinanensis]GGL01185.1 membrane protein [Nocardia jinanensis]